MIDTCEKPSASSAARIAPIRPSIISLGLTTSAPARACIEKCKRQPQNGVLVEYSLSNQRIYKQVLDISTTVSNIQGTPLKGSNLKIP